MLNSDNKNVRSTRLCALERYWNEKRGNGAMPMRAQIDPLEIARLLPIVLMAEIVHKNAFIRLLGSETTASYGNETRGRWIGDLSFGVFTANWREALTSVMNGAARASAAGFYSAGTQICRVETVLLPLSDNGGKLRYIFGGLIIKPAHRDSLGQRQTPKSFFIESGRDRHRNLPVDRNGNLLSGFSAGSE